MKNLMLICTLIMFLGTSLFAQNSVKPISVKKKSTTQTTNQNTTEAPTKSQSSPSNTYKTKKSKKANRNYQDSYNPGNYGQKSLTENRTVISTRPLSLVFKQPNLKVEHAFGRNISAGGELTYFTGLNSGIKVDPFVRLYMDKHNNAPQGFYMQGKFSYGSHEKEVGDIEIDSDEITTGDNPISFNNDKRFSAWGGGFGLGSQWFVGASDNLSIDLFAGLKRYKATNGGAVDNTLFNWTRNWPVEMRFSVGYAF